METHRIQPELLERQVRVLVVGCGGTGSAVVAGLPYLHQSLVARGHPGGLHVTVVDGDTISVTNCVRQPFARSEVGLNKAVVLVNRLNLFWGLKWEAVPRHLHPGTFISRSYSGDDLRAPGRPRVLETKPESKQAQFAVTSNLVKKGRVRV